MIIRTVIALAIGLATVSTAFAATKHRFSAPRESAFENRNSFVNSDPDRNVRWDIQRDPSTDR